MAIIVFGLVACVAILPGQADFLGVIYAFGAMLSFTIAHLALIRLRVSHPEVERPWSSPRDSLQGAHPARCWRSSAASAPASR